MTRFPLLLLGLFALALGSPARADITRGCRASIMVMGPEITANLQRLIEMDASGTCRRTQPNQCRLRAHQTLRACIGALWVGRGNHAIPAACQTGMGGSGRMNWTRWVGISPNLPHGPNSLVDRIRREACCPTRRFDVVHVRVRYGITGDDGCSGSAGGRYETVDQDDLDTRYRIDCGRQQALGICGSVPRRTNP
ncbi:MAG: hypothetical protein H6900_06085 [Rhodobacter sp.]|uniref:hypothetical protein n=1 Tax=Pararhodobacter sp. TaxID=2127056 RepID=UPI001D976ED9|nr:hypothetical protein [Pararhodobacter sp.]MCB1344874.1 hypothetical protein [Paracoccaceae bacterium]MCC0072843.1 hypothetical protein [Rhodobacter sp.]HPD90951.1 hypothetical protein [Pararhodobacter sp.]